MYEHVELIHEGERARVSRAVRQLDGLAVVIKQLRGAWPSPEELAKFRREFDMLSAVDGEGAPRALAFEVCDGVAQIIMEDLGGSTLASVLAARRPNNHESVALALRIAEALEKTHARGVLHRDLNPSNLLVSADADKVWLIDFGLSSRVAHGVSAARPIAYIEGTPAYLAPEQTGRMNRAVDLRSDLYALGATLYELFAARPPFVCADLLEYVHAHLAREPADLGSQVWALPPLVSDLVATLLRKRPEERYQSASGVVIDLRRSLEALSADAPGEDLALAGQSLSERCEFPQELHGREGELATLTAAFEGACGGERGAVLISGEPGIGKSSLVFELHRPITVANGRLLLGKFDQFTRDVPFAALSEALQGCVEDMLSEAHDAVEEWRLRLMAAVGPNGRLLTDLVPASERLLGPQPPTEELGPTEAEHRLQATLIQVFCAVAQAGHPVVLFLDDLQWADLPSLRVIEALFRAPELTHLLLVGAWRDTEVSGDHILRPTLAVLRASGAGLEEIHLGPLRTADVETLLGETLRQSREEVRELSGILWAKTRGNPFFLRRLVEELSHEGALRFDRAALGWRWDLNAVRERAVTDNVVSFLRHDLELLSGDARQCLSAAAWIGARFDLELLAVATGLSPVNLQSALRVAIDRRLVVPRDEDYWDAASAFSRNFVFSFVHDRIQQAASELLSADAAAHVRLAIARGMRALRGGASTDTDLFRLAEHYNAAIELVTLDTERSEVARIDQEAGRRALQSTAYGAAHRFLEAAVTLAGPAAWAADPAGTRALYFASARAAWLVGDQALMASRVAEIRRQAHSDLDRLEAEQVIIQAQIARGEPHEAITAAVDALSAAGITLPRHPAFEDVVKGIGAGLGAIGARSADELAVLAPNDDPTEQAARRMLMGISSASYVATPNLLPLISARLVIQSVERGMSRESSFGFAVFALSLCAGWNLGIGYTYGSLALRLLARFPDAAFGGRTRHVVNHFVRAWTEPLRVIYAEAPELTRSLMNVGDLEYAGWVLEAQAVYGYFAGVSLDALGPEIDRAMALMQQHQLDAAYHLTVQFSQLVRAMRGDLEDPTRLTGHGFDESKALAGYLSTGFRAAALVLAVCMLSARVIFRDYPGAVEAARVAFEVQDGALAIFYQCVMRAYAAVAELSTLDGLSPEALDEKLAKVRGWRVQVAVAAERGPHNASHLLALLDAELARAEGDTGATIDRYDEAIARAAENGFVHDEALANERAGLFHLARGSRSVARAYLIEARFGWQRWGAKAKVAQLDALHGELLSPALRPMSGAYTATASQSLHRTTDGARVSLDLDTLLKASQAISGEVELDRLLTRAMQVLLENVGARRGILMLRGRGGLGLEAEGLAEGVTVELLRGAPIDDSVRVPSSIVRRVWRKGVAEVYDDASAAPELATDAYVQRVRPRSVLCAPVQFQGRSLGVLYFENNLSVGAFVPARVRVLEVLAPQVAISVENARLHAAQGRFVPRQFLRSLSRENIVDVEIGDHVLKEVSVFFSDIRRFTSMVERLPAAEALAFINAYLAHAEPAITGNKGFVDTYLGDGIMALFDVAGSNADDAVAGAVAMQHALARFNEERVARGRRAVHTGIGINTGTVMLATIGGQQSLKCGVVGDPVNLAARIEGLTKRDDSSLLISEATYRRMRMPERVTMRRAGRVRVVGREQPLTLYQVVDAEPEAQRAVWAATREVFEQALEDFYAGDLERAIRGFEACLDTPMNDPIARRYRDWAQKLHREGLPEGWEGVENVSTK